jgi:cytochrome bd-type quinol oxidase subunit 1
VKLRYSDDAWETMQRLPDAQRAQARQLIRAIMLAEVPVGRLWIRDLRGRQLWIASALDTHVIHRAVYTRTANTMYIIQILTFPTPPDPNNA